jgi:hypothetical protein
MAFRVGMKVVCVDDSNIVDLRIVKPVKGVIYIVRGITAWNSIFLNEIVNPVLRFSDSYGDWEAEPSFWSWRFRPVVESKTDISVFTKMLKSETEKV